MDPSENAPQAQGPAAEPATQPPAPAPAKKKKKGTLRERVAQDREIQRLKKREMLMHKIPQVLGVLVVAAVLVFAFRAPLLRVLAKSDSSFGVWALDRLAGMRDAGSFELYVEQLGVGRDTQSFNELVFLGAGRRSIPDPGGDPGPEVPDAVTEHKEILRASVAGSGPMRRGALYALWTLKQRSWTRETPLLQAVGAVLDPPCDDAVARRYAAMVLKATPAPQELHDPLLRAALKDEDRLVRKNAVQALGNTEDPAVAEQLMPALGDPYPEVRREASLALARLKADIPFSTLAQIYHSDPPSMQADVLRVIAQQPDPGVVPLLVEAVTAQAASTRHVAVTSLADRDGDDARRGLENALRDRSPAVRMAAIEALQAREDGRRAVPSLVDALRRHEGWGEISALHGALTTITGAEVPAPTPLEETWPPCINGWDAHLEGGDQ